MEDFEYREMQKLRNGTWFKEQGPNLNLLDCDQAQWQPIDNASGSPQNKPYLNYERESSNGRNRW